MLYESGSVTLVTRLRRRFSAKTWSARLRIPAGVSLTDFESRSERTAVSTWRRYVLIFGEVPKYSVTAKSPARPLSRSIGQLYAIRRPLCQSIIRVDGQNAL